jgi:hypothetical protein
MPNISLAQTAMRALCAAPPDIKPGQGIYFSAARNSFYAKNCDANSYGKCSARIVTLSI